MLLATWSPSQRQNIGRYGFAIYYNPLISIITSFIGISRATQSYVYIISMINTIVCLACVHISLFLPPSLCPPFLSSSLLPSPLPFSSSLPPFLFLSLGLLCWFCRTQWPMQLVTLSFTSMTGEWMWLLGVPTSTSTLARGPLPASLFMRNRLTTHNYQGTYRLTYT